jgi:hypothetical protein
VDELRSGKAEGFARSPGSVSGSGFKGGNVEELAGVIAGIELKSKISNP